MSNIIGISGVKGSGKSTCCNFLFGISLAAIECDDGGPLVSYVKIHPKTGHVIAPANIQDNPRIFNTKTCEWEASSDGVGEERMADG